ncbi:MAG: DUF3109 family protein [Chlorobi bacterium]|nr:DUF3109 family protein [Chlorobiota bacterium]
MLQINDTIISLDILDKNFTCNLEKCKGACCIKGDSGAPLEEEELEIIESIYPLIRKYLTTEGDIAIKANGGYTIDSDGDYVTTLVNNNECAYVYFENGIAKCCIEKAFNDGIIDFKKPVSCHLYPVRIKKYKSFQGVNYDKSELCKSAVKLGNKIKQPLFIFLEEPLKRKFGENWYKQLHYAGINKDKIIS